MPADFPGRVLLPFTVINGSFDKAHMYTFSMKIVQGSTQYEADTDFELPQFDSEIMPGITVSGVAKFPLFDVSQPFQVVIDGSTDNFRLDTTDHVFTVG